VARAGKVYMQNLGEILATNVHLEGGKHKLDVSEMVGGWEMEVPSVLSSHGIHWC
jgi:hypothetical protein